METRIQVTGMGCGGCVDTVSKALQSVGKVHVADVSLETGLAVVHHGTDVMPQALVEAVRAEGYGAELATAASTTEAADSQVVASHATAAHATAAH